MFIRSTLLYFLARGLPAIINFMMIALYTRLLSPDQYGRYILVVAAAGIANTFLFHWLRHGVLRFLPRAGDRPEALLSTLLAGFLGSVAVSAFVGAIIYWLWPDPLWRPVVLFGVLILWAQAWFDLNLKLAESHIQPIRYGLFSVLKTGLMLTVGVGLVFLGAGFYGPVFGMLIGTAVAAFALMWRQWPGVHFRLVDKDVLRSVMVYGLPLTATLGLDAIVGTSDRFLLTWIAGTTEAGTYAAAYDLGWMSLTTLFMVVNLAAYPLTVRLLEQDGPEAARGQLQQTLLMLVAVGLPSAIGLGLCAAPISSVVLGPEFRETGTELLPWVAAACFIAGLKAYYFDLSFQLSFRTIGQVWVSLTAAVLNVLLNLWWIPLHGLYGAIYATLASYTVGVLLSWWFGRQLFRRPAVPAELFKPVVAAMVMGAALWPYRLSQSLPELVGMILLGVGVYAIMLMITDFMTVRQRLWRLLISRLAASS